MKEQLVFGLDIGTRSIVGTVGYKKGDKFVVVAQRIREHDSRSMLDGQIHDIQKVGDTIRIVKSELEEATGEKLSGVCIAAAGRNLCTINTSVENDIENREVTQEDIYNLVSAGVEKAYEEFLNSKTAKDTEDKFYCVGHSVVRYYLNGSQIGNLEGHKARNIGLDLIATFLPDEVVDSLYKAVEIAGLTVNNLTLEPIAAIGLAIPERFRMLNLALIDVGAGTSDISITNDGCILAFGMIPMAGDALTEVIAKACLVDFAEAERIKRESDTKDVIEYFDIMLLPQTITAEEVKKITNDTIEVMATEAAEKIKALNGGKSTSAVFIVGGGGKMTGYAEAVAKKLDLQKERVALRGEEVMQNIIFNEEVKKDSLLVTPIGICLNYYEQSNNFIFVSFNGSRIKMYDNNNLTVGDVAVQAQFPNEDLFPKRGEALEFTVNEKKRMIRGVPGEAAKIFVNDEEATIATTVRENDIIKVIPSTAGDKAVASLENISELDESIEVVVNGSKVSVPKFAEVNGALQSKYYDINTDDDIRIMNYYSVQQIADFMDVILDPKMNIYVNNSLADRDTKVYNNFSVNWTLETMTSERETLESNNSEEEKTFEELYGDEAKVDDSKKNSETDSYENLPEDDGVRSLRSITITVNGMPTVLSGKSSYVFVDVFDYIDFNLTDSRGRNVVTKLNGRQAQYMENLKDADAVEVYWDENK